MQYIYAAILDCKKQESETKWFAKFTSAQMTFHRQLDLQLFVICTMLWIKNINNPR